MRLSRSMVLTVRILTAVFLALYLIVLSVSYIPNSYIHRTVKQYAVKLVEKKYDDAREQARESQVTGRAEEAVKKWLPEQADRLDALAGALDFLDKQFREALNQFLDEDVIDEKAMRKFYRSNRAEYEPFSISKALQGNDYVINWIRVKYYGTLLGLKQEIRRAAFWNLLIYALIFSLTFRYRSRIFIPAFIAMAAVSVLSIYTYLFRTDWLMKILEGDFGGSEYLVFYATTLFFLVAGVIFDRGASAEAD